MQVAPGTAEGRYMRFPKIETALSFLPTTMPSAKRMNPARTESSTAPSDDHSRAQQRLKQLQETAAQSRQAAADAEAAAEAKRQAVLEEEAFPE